MIVLRKKNWVVPFLLIPLQHGNDCSLYLSGETQYQPFSYSVSQKNLIKQGTGEGCHAATASAYAPCCYTRFFDGGEGDNQVLEHGGAGVFQLDRGDLMGRGVKIHSHGVAILVVGAVVNECNLPLHIGE